MRNALRLLLPMVLLLGAMTLCALLIVDATSRRWFLRDIEARAQLAVHGAHEALVLHWRSGDHAGIGRQLEEIARDERITAAEACGADLGTLAHTLGFPEAYDCRRIGERGSASSAVWRAWNQILEGEGVHLSAVPVRDGDEVLGFVVLVHDLSLVDQREAVARHFFLVAFALLAATACAGTLIAYRLSWRTWLREMRHLLRGSPGKPEFHPLMQDVRELASRLAAEADDAPHGLWTPQRLRQTLTRHLHGERVIIAANREPYIHERLPDGAIKVVHPASGLVTALEPVMRACSGVWVAHGSGSADRETADAQGRLAVPPGDDAYQLRRVWLSPEEEKGYYYGFANEGLWPLCHLAHVRPTFRIEDWGQYQSVSQRFADAVCAEAGGPDPIILVQDYHFALLPRMIREKLPRATIIAFWHIPWPNAERVGICPWYPSLLEGMLGSSILGFHTQQHCNNFLEAVDRFMEARIDREKLGVMHHGRLTLVRPYPISIEWPNRWAAAAPPPAECHQGVLAELGLGPGALIGLGVDRLDYTKGIEERLLAAERLLERFPHLRGRFSLVQLSAPSRTAIDRYRDLSTEVERLAARINERFGGPGYRPIVIRREHHEPPTVFRYYRAADFCYVSSLHDGMNLVAKEFVSARSDERGALVLSQFTGAARELTEALIVNPYDLEQASSAMAAALSMSEDEQAERMRAMRAYLAELNVYRWAGRMLVDAARLRQRDRLTDRLAFDLRSEGMAS